ncbi:MAG: hypothetical protein WKF37_02265 [Bryobacteraceae bacterium]
MTFAKRPITERLAVFDHFALVSEALKYGRGYARVQDVEANVAARSTPLGGHAPEFVVVAHGRPNAPGRQYTSQEMIATERDVLAMTKAGRFQVEPIAAAATEQSLKAEYQSLHNGLGLNANQLKAAVGLLSPGPDHGTPRERRNGKDDFNATRGDRLCKDEGPRDCRVGANRARTQRTRSCRDSRPDTPAISHPD